MKFSLSWLKEYIDVDIPARVLADKLTAAGLSVETVEQSGTDAVFTVEITSNRPDWLSIIGIARETAAISGKKKINLPAALPLKAVSPRKHSFSILLEDEKACSRYVGRIIRGARIGDSPEWMRRALEAVGARVINNAVDITNYVMYETGQPMHVFDFDKLEGGVIVVRRAKKGETIVTIDGVKRELDETILVIADAKKPVAAAGIMGGLETQVTRDTKNILLESAYFDPVTIRRGSRRLGLATESNYRFERRVDPESVLFASCRGAYLLSKLCAGGVREPYLDANFLRRRARKIVLDARNISRLTGLNVPVSRAGTILKSLGFSAARGRKRNTLLVGVPGLRGDVNLEEDLIEEIARITGYGKIAESLPPVKAGSTAAFDRNFSAKARARRLLLGLGFDEAVTYSLLSAKNLDDALSAKEDRVGIQNPLSVQQEVMRNSFISSLLKVINTNLNRRNKNVNVFEIGKIYRKKNGSFAEAEYCAMAACGMKLNNWLDHGRPVNFYDLKGALETLLDGFGIADYQWRKKTSACFFPEQSAAVFLGDREIAVLGKISAPVLMNFDIAEDVYFAAVEMAALAENRKLRPRYRPVPKFPSVVRDIAVVVKKEVSAGAALDIIRETAGTLAVKTELFDVYTAEPVPPDSKSLAFSVEYRRADATLTEEEVNQVHARVQDALRKRLNAALR